MPKKLEQELKREAKKIKRLDEVLDEEVKLVNEMAVVEWAGIDKGCRELSDYVKAYWWIFTHKN